MKVKIEIATIDYLNYFLAIQQTNFVDNWKHEFFDAENSYLNKLCLLAFSLPNKYLVGYLIIWLVIDEAQIQIITVHPNFRRRGIGKYLLTEGIKQAMKQGATWASLEVRISNLAARYLYSSFGFIEQGRRPRYYQPQGEDALLLNFKLK